jgi:DNA invertase Pin-like site-specific DNA recombinase
VASCNKKEGDTVIVPDLTRLSRNLKDMIELVNLFGEKGCHFISLKEGWNFNLGTAMGNMQLHLFGMLAQYERDLIAERTRERLRAAAKKGRFPGRPQIDSDKVKYARFLLE